MSALPKPKNWIARIPIRATGEAETISRWVEEVGFTELCKRVQRGKRTILPDTPWVMRGPSHKDPTYQRIMRDEIFTLIARGNARQREWLADALREYFE